MRQVQPQQQPVTLPQYQTSMQVHQQMPPPPLPPVQVHSHSPGMQMPEQRMEVPLAQTQAKTTPDALDASSALWYQQLLDTNEELMQAIVENMHIGRFEDCVQ